MVGKLTLADRVARVQQAVDTHQPELAVTTTQDIIILEGPFVISGPLGPIDSYQVKVYVSADFPWEEPIVFETGNRIPKIVDRHIFPKHGNCCLGIWEEWLLTLPSCNFANFLTIIMHDYFVSQTYFEAHGEWPFGERSHGDAGVLESFASLLGTEEDLTTVIRYLKLISKKEIKGHNICPCGCGRRLRLCQRAEVDELKKRIPLAIARRMLKRIAPKQVSTAA